MPTYAYACKDCGHEFEVFQSFDDDSLTTCTSCEGRLRKVFNVGGVVFKGSGFYRNDSRSAGSGSSGSGSTASSTPAPSTSGASASGSSSPSSTGSAAAAAAS